MRQMVLGSLLAVVCTGCVAPLMRSTVPGPSTPRQSAELWEAPNDLADEAPLDGIGLAQHQGLFTHERWRLAAGLPVLANGRPVTGRTFRERRRPCRAIR